MIDRVRALYVIYVWQCSTFTSFDSRRSRPMRGLFRCSLVSNKEFRYDALLPKQEIKTRLELLFAGMLTLFVALSLSSRPEPSCTRWCGA